MNSLDQKVLIMIVGPAAIGKTTLMNTVVKLDSECSYVRSFTTRPRRQNEISHYHFISRTEALDLRRTGKTITFFEHPTTRDIYGTTAESYQTRFSLLDTLSTTVKEYRNLAFERTITISLTASPEQWREWFVSRYPEPSEEASKRLKEAEYSITWSLTDPKSHWLLNPAGETELTARTLIHLITSDIPQSSPPDEAKALLAFIQSGIY